jgi:hypothetical protein
MMCTCGPGRAKPIRSWGTAALLAMIAVALSAVPTAAAQPPPGVTRDDLDSHPLGHGRY